MAKPAVFGLVNSEAQARIAVTALESAGFIATDISVLSGGLSYDINGMPESGFAKTRKVGHTNSTKAPEGTAAGVTTGGVLGGLAGWLVGIGVLSIPGLGPFLAAGPIMTALSGAAIGATAGGLAGALIGFGIPEFEAKLYAGKVEAGHILIGIHTVNDDEAATARKALEDAGAEHIKVTCEVAAE